MSLVLLGKIEPSNKITYRFRTVIEQLIDLENHVMSMVKNIKFGNVNDRFLKKLSIDIKEIRKSDKMLDIEDHVRIMQESEVYITIKDHKK